MTAVPLTDQQLADIRDREAAATRGPWGYFDGDNYADLAADYQQTGRGSYTCRQGIARLEEDGFWDDQANEGRDEGDAYEQMIANAEFITHARADVPALLAELDRLRAELEQARQQAAAVLAVCDQAEKGATRWEQPLPVPDWVAVVRAAAQPAANAPGCGCQTHVHPGHYPSCPTRATQPSV